MLAMTGKKGFPVLLFRFLIGAFRNDGHGGLFPFLLPPLREGAPGFPAKSMIWQGGRGRGFFEEKHLSQ